ncbi:hypothetical protein B7L51_001120 [Pectobacterium brasiliense]|uniref:hypothetical protein n=1 Tax=Pectobacterium brasiliense TaxID=180957 RepID=UPI0011408A60|nr:hypothetical protein [Pectobacterium carotovorum]
MELLNEPLIRTRNASDSISDFCPTYIHMLNGGYGPAPKREKNDASPVVKKSGGKSRMAKQMDRARKIRNKRLKGEVNK